VLNAALAAAGYPGPVQDVGEIELIRVQPDRHLGGANYLMADGHAKWYLVQQTMDPNNFLWGDIYYPYYTGAK
jgi:prepilin-type processing-associated H-X9-DG protein